MSLILDALRKMEQERRVRRSGLGSVRSSVLNYRGDGDAVRGKKPIVAVALLVTALGAAAGGFFIASSRKSSPPLSTPDVKVSPPLPSAPLNAINAVTPSANVPFPKGSKAKEDVHEKPVNQVTVQKNGDNGITLSGIAWQDERTLRRAVVNGFLVEEGAEVQGARIVEIKENHIRFSKGGEMFDVVYNDGALK